MKLVHVRFVRMITYSEHIQIVAIQRLAYDVKPDILLGVDLSHQLLVASIAVRREVGKIDGILQQREV